MSTASKIDEQHKQLFEEGLKMRRSVVGDVFVDRALANGSTEFSFLGLVFVSVWCWGYVWGRPGLEKKQRSLLNLGLLMALNRGPELAAHVRGARKNGLSELEIREAILHCTIYCGVPAGVDAMKTAEKVLNEMAESGEMPRELGGKAAEDITGTTERTQAVQEQIQWFCVFIVKGSLLTAQRSQGNWCSNPLRETRTLY